MPEVSSNMCGQATQPQTNKHLAMATPATPATVLPKDDVLLRTRTELLNVLNTIARLLKIGELTLDGILDMYGICLDNEGVTKSDRWKTKPSEWTVELSGAILSIVKTYWHKPLSKDVEYELCDVLLKLGSMCARVKHRPPLMRCRFVTKPATHPVYSKNRYCGAHVTGLHDLVCKKHDVLTSELRSRAMKDAESDTVDPFYIQSCGSCSNIATKTILRREGCRCCVSDVYLCGDCDENIRA